MEFKKYPKIYTKDKVIPKIRQLGIDLLSTWVATEKVHGANFQVMFENGEFKLGRRKGFIEDPKTFYNSERVLARYEHAFKLIASDYKDTTVRLFCELFGGEYPYKDVPQIDGISRVQKGVWYTPDLDIIVYDVQIGDCFVPHEDVECFAINYGLLTVPVLARGELDDILQLPTTFESRIYKFYGLPKIEGNLAEGYVVKYDDPKPFFRNGKRIIFKCINPKFKETKAAGKPKKPIVLSKEAQEVYNILCTGITNNRVEHVLSHDSYDNFGKLQGAVVQDIIEELEIRDLLKELDSKERKHVMRLAMKEIGDIIRNEFLDQIVRR